MHLGGPRASTALALGPHERATDAVKCGAFSREGGSLCVAVNRHDDQVELVWSNTGGPARSGPPLQSGFGFEMLDRIFAAQMKATVLRDWRPDGVRMAIRIPVDRPALAGTT